MHTAEYLYDLDASQLSNMLYPDALKFKIQSANQLIGKLIEPHYSERDDHRIAAVQRAIKYNQFLLEELK